MRILANGVYCMSMENIFAGAVVYAESWKPVEERPVNQQEINATERVEITTESSYGGLTAKIHLKTGGYCFFGVSRDSTLTVGDTPRMEDLKIIALKRGDQTCLKVDLK